MSVLSRPEFCDEEAAYANVERVSGRLVSFACIAVKQGAQARRVANLPASALTSATVTASPLRSKFAPSLKAAMLHDRLIASDIPDVRKQEGHDRLWFSTPTRLRAI